MHLAVEATKKQGRRREEVDLGAGEVRRRGGRGPGPQRLAHALPQVLRDPGTKVRQVFPLKSEDLGVGPVKGQVTG